MRIQHFVIGLLIAIALNASAQNIIKGNYAIKNVQTSKLLRPKDANKNLSAEMVLYMPSNWKCMTWEFIHIDSNYYKLRNLFTDKTFQPIREKAVQGNFIEQQNITDGAMQIWEFIPQKEGKYSIRLKGSDLYLTPVDKTGATNSRIFLDKKTPSSIQLWTIYEQSPDI